MKDDNIIKVKITPDKKESYVFVFHNLEDRLKMLQEEQHKVVERFAELQYKIERVWVEMKELKQDLGGEKKQ